MNTSSLFTCQWNWAIRVEGYILMWPRSFIFTLQEFAGELVSLTDAMRRIYAVELARFSRQNWFKRYFINGPKSFLSCIKSFRRRRQSEKTTRAGLRRICKHCTERLILPVFQIDSWC